jgi:hypothetical protein
MTDDTNIVAAIDDDRQSARIYSLHPWRCTHHSNHSEIVAYVEASGQWETVLTVNPTSETSAKTMATFIMHLVNSYRQNNDLLRVAMKALESVMQEGLTYSTEQEVDAAVASIQQAVNRQDKPKQSNFISKIKQQLQSRSSE